MYKTTSWHYSKLGQNDVLSIQWDERLEHNGLVHIIRMLHFEDLKMATAHLWISSRQAGFEIFNINIRGYGVQATNNHNPNSLHTNVHFKHDSLQSLAFNA